MSLSSFLNPSFPTFYAGCNDWQVYTERLEQFFATNRIADDKKTAVLLISVSEDVFKTLRNLCHPDRPQAKSFEELRALLDRHFNEPPAVFRERTAFYTARQDASESMAGWHERLIRLSIDCKFGDRFEAVLLDRFVSGLRPGAVWERLCEEDVTGLSMKKAVEIATNKEMEYRGA